MSNAFVHLEKAVNKLTFAVHLLDDFSKQDFLVGATKVFLKENDREAFRNPSGYYIFLDLIGDSFALRVENKYYVDQEIGVNISDLDPKHPVVTTIVKPNYLYPFPRGSTIIRGKTVDPEQKPVSDVTIEIVGADITNTSGDDGRFVLYFGPLTDEDINVQNSHRYVKVNGNTSVKLRAKHPDYKSKTVTIGKIEEGEKKLLTTPISLDPK